MKSLTAGLLFASFILLLTSSFNYMVIADGPTFNMDQVWSHPLSNSVLATQPCDADSGETFFIFEANQYLSRIVTHSGEIVFNISVPNFGGIVPAVASAQTFMVQYTPSVSPSVNYIAIQRASSVVVFSFSETPANKEKPLNVFQFAWEKPADAIFAKCIITEFHTLIVPYIDSKTGNFELRSYTINPATASSNSNAAPKYSTFITKTYANVIQIMKAGSSIFVSTTGFLVNEAWAINTIQGTIRWNKNLEFGANEPVFITPTLGYIFFRSKQWGYPLQLVVLDPRTGDQLANYGPQSQIMSLSVSPDSDAIDIFTSEYTLRTFSNNFGSKVAFPTGFISQPPNLLFGGRSALFLNTKANNQMYNLSNGFVIGNNDKPLPWTCDFTSSSSGNCDRPASGPSAMSVYVPQQQGSSGWIVFTSIHPEPKSFKPCIVDGKSGEILGYASQQHFNSSSSWVGASSVIAASQAAATAVFKGQTGEALFEYPLLLRIIFDRVVSIFTVDSTIQSSLNSGQSSILPTGSITTPPDVLFQGRSALFVGARENNWVYNLSSQMPVGNKPLPWGCGFTSGKCDRPSGPSAMACNVQPQIGGNSGKLIFTSVHAEPGKFQPCIVDGVSGDILAYGSQHPNSNVGLNFTWTGPPSLVTVDETTATAIYMGQNAGGQSKYSGNTIIAYVYLPAF